MHKEIVNETIVLLITTTFELYSVDIFAVGIQRANYRSHLC